MNKKFHYIKIKDDKPKNTNKRKSDKVWRNIGHAMTVVGTTISSMLLILVIMLCIVATVVVVYILDFAKTNSFDIDLKDVETKFTTIVYAHDAEGNEVELKRLANVENRIWVDYEDISKNIIYAVVAKEDQRFWEHEGVDWRRTVFALVQDALKTDRAGEGGSTITQQLVKNITEDDERTWERKIREIFRALSLEERYTKEDILESYLNKIWFGKMVYGIEAASQTYFGKSASDVDIAEAAILAGIIKSPDKNRPNSDLAACKESQLVTLYAMYEQGYISLKEYEEAKVEQVKFVPVVHGDAFGYIDPRSIQTEEPDDTDTPDDNDADDSVYEAYKWNEGTYEVSQNWYTDAAIRQVIEDYADLKGIKFESAKNEIYNGGYKIYTNMDMEKQAILEEKYRNPYLVVKYYDKNEKDEKLVQSSFVVMDYNGTVVALAGGLGEKKGDNCFNRATMATRAPGSTMKPISPYAMGVQTNLITYSQLIPDKGIPVNFQSTPWPHNYGTKGSSGELTPVWKAVRHSWNTIPVRIAHQLTPQVLYNHLVQNMGITTLDPENDINLSPLTLGGLSKGVKMIELAAAYQVFGNGGIHYEPKLYSRVLDSKNNVILEQDYYGNQALDSDAAWVVNRMLRTVVTAPGYGNLAPYAELPNVEIVGKTGTSNDGKNILFVGLTPDYVGVVWVGCDDGSEVENYNKVRYCPKIWHDVMEDIQDTSQNKLFIPDPTVLERQYCMESGLLASSSCTQVNIGYYRPSNIPTFCSGDHEEEQQKIRDYWNAIDNQIRAEIKP